MQHRTRKDSSSHKRTGKSRLWNRQALTQTLGGITVLSIIPLSVTLCFSQDIHAWVKSLFDKHLQKPTAKTDSKSHQFLFPNSILQIAEVSQVEPNQVAADTQMVRSNASQAVMRLQRVLNAHSGSRPEEVLRAANKSRSGERSAVCPFESIKGEQSLVLAKGADGYVSLAKSLDRCADAIERIPTTRK